MGAEVFRYDQTLPSKLGSRPTLGLRSRLRCPLRRPRPTPLFQALPARFALARRTQQDSLTALANSEPVAGAQRKEAQSLQWFLSESRWDPKELNERRLELMVDENATAPSEEVVLVIDEHADRKWGKHTAHVGRQWLANIGKTESGVVSVSSLWADERVYYPVDFEPYTPSLITSREASKTPHFAPSSRSPRSW